MVQYELTRITIARIRKPQHEDVNSELQWLSQSLGLFGDRDKEKSCFRIFVELIKAARKNKGLTSDELAARSNITRATVIHHLKKLIASGLVLVEGNYYYLRVHNLQALIDEVQKDLNHTFEDLRIMAKELDEQLGLLQKKEHTLSD